MTNRVGLKRKKSSTRSKSKKFIVIHWKTRNMKGGSSVTSNDGQIRSLKARLTRSVEKLVLKETVLPSPRCVDDTAKRPRYRLIALKVLPKDKKNRGTMEKQESSRGRNKGEEAAVQCTLSVPPAKRDASVQCSSTSLLLGLSPTKSKEEQPCCSFTPKYMVDYFSCERRSRLLGKKVCQKEVPKPDSSCTPEE